MTDRADWIDDDAPPRQGGRRMPLLVAAIVPWLIVAFVVLRGDGAVEADAPAAADLAGGVDAPAPADPPTEERGAAAATEPHDRTGMAAPSTDPDTGASSDDGTGESPEAEVHSSTELSLGVAEATAVAIARAWLSDGGPDLTVDGVNADRRAYLEHVTVERVELAGADHAVATLSLVLLEREDDTYVDVLVRRAAVPLRLTDATIRPAGAPWWLPSPPDLSPTPPAADAVDDAATRDDVLRALVASGYRDPDVLDVAETSDGTVVAEVDGITTTGERLDGPVWLVPAGEGLRVLGHFDDDRL